MSGAFYEPLEDLGRVLVTGADGFIGSHLTEALLAGGARVRAFTMYNSLGSRGWLEGLEAEKLGAGELEVVAGDVRDASTVRSAVRGCDTVLHLAALIAIQLIFARQLRSEANGERRGVKSW